MKAEQESTRKKQVVAQLNANRMNMCHSEQSDQDHQLVANQFPAPHASQSQILTERGPFKPKTGPSKQSDKWIRDQFPAPNASQSQIWKERSPSQPNIGPSKQSDKWIRDQFPAPNASQSQILKESSPFQPNIVPTVSIGERSKILRTFLFMLSNTTMQLPI